MGVLQSTCVKCSFFDPSVIECYKSYISDCKPEKEPFRNKIKKLQNEIQECRDKEQSMNLFLDLMKIFARTPCCGDDFFLEKGKCMAIECRCGSYFCGWCRSLPNEIGCRSKLQAHVCNCVKNPNDRIVMRETGEDGLVRRVPDPHFKRYPNAKNPTQYELQRKIKTWNSFLNHLGVTTIREWIDSNKARILEAIDGGMSDSKSEKVIFLDGGKLKLEIMNEIPDEDIIMRRIPFGPQGIVEFSIRRGNAPVHITDDMLMHFVINATIGVNVGGINAEAVEEFQNVVARLREERRGR